MDTIQDYVKRPLQYFNVDGLNEIVMGVFALAAGASFWLADTKPQNSLWHEWGAWLWVPAVALASFGAEAIRKRITYPRTGFMKLRRDRSTIILTMAAGAIVAALLALALWRMRVHPGLFNPSVFLAILGILFGAAYGARISRQAKWKWIIALVMAGGSLAICFYPGSTIELVLGLFVLFGVSFVISGGISFYLYLRHTQTEARGAE